MRVEEYYNQAAEEDLRFYQKDAWWMKVFLHRPIEKHILSVLSRYSSGASSIMDIGSGTGRLLSQVLPETVKQVRIIDPAEKMLALASNRIKISHPKVQVETYRSALPELKTDLAASDVSICVGVLNHIPQKELETAIKRISELTFRRIILYYAHTGFMLSKYTGRHFRSQGIHYQSISSQMIQEEMLSSGFELKAMLQPFHFSLLSPLCGQIYDKT